MVESGLHSDVSSVFNWTYRSSPPDSDYESSLDPVNVSDVGGSGSVAGRVHPSATVGLGLVCLPMMTIAGSLVTCLAVRWDSRMHHTSYYFSVSMALLHAIMASAVMPPAILLTWQGEYRCSDALCKLWITADLFFCNNTCLHLAFMNMDTFLRLKDPLRHGRNVTACSLVLWLGAPWAVSLVQSVAQFMLSQADADSRSRPGLCFIADKNFVILGTLFSFVIPSVVAVSFAALCRHEIRALKGRILCSTGLTSEVPVYPGSETGAGIDVDDDEEEDRMGPMGDYDESLNASDSTCSGGAEEEDSRSESMSVRNMDRASIMTEQVQLEVVGGGGGGGGLAPADAAEATTQSNRTTMKPSGVTSASAAARESSVDSNCDEDTTAFCTDRNGLQHHQQQTEETYRGGVQMMEQHSSVSSNAILLRQSGFHDSADRDHLMHHSGTTSSSGCSPFFGRSTGDDFRNIPDQTLRQELAISWLAALMMTVHIVLWLPLSVSNVVYGVCQPCRDAMTFTGAVTFKWLAYSSAAVATVVYAQFSESMRQVYWNIISCRYCRLRHRGLP